MSILVALSLLLTAATVAIVVALIARRRLQERIRRLREELVEVSADASVGHRLSVGEHRDVADLADLAATINRLFDALGERDQKIQGRDRLFRDFARTLPEIVLIHDEKILLANDSAAALIGLEPAQLVGRDVVDL